MTDEEFYEHLESSKECGKCGRVQKVSEFPWTTAYGKPVIRSWCHDCLNSYYRDRATRRRQQQKEEIEQGKQHPFTRKVH